MRDRDPNKLVSIFNPTHKEYSRRYQGKDYIIPPLGKLDNIPYHVAENLARHLAYETVAKRNTPTIQQRHIKELMDEIRLYD